MWKIIDNPDIAIAMTLFNAIQLLFQIHAGGPEILDLPFLPGINMGVVIVKMDWLPDSGHFFQQMAEFPGGFVIIADVQGWEIIKRLIV
ncbi:MAG: hypothetical protein R2860_12080 [Desulfobacterales bacterium]